MSLISIEIKAKSANHKEVRTILKSANAKFIGEDHQIDTYFNVKKGRLKLREGLIENNLIHYIRKNTKGPKQSKVLLFKSEPNSILKEILTSAIGILTVVDKKREIYFIDNVKFHIDTVNNLGTFIEIEAIDKSATVDKAELLSQCRYYLDLFKVGTEDLVASSYSDLLLKKKAN